MTELDQVMQSFSTISESLLRSYEALADRARLVEDELHLANRELEAKVEELDAVNRHLETVLQALPTGVVVRDRDGTIVRVNDAALSILGVTSDELDGPIAHDLIHDPDADGEAVSDLQRADGSRLVLATRRAPIQDGAGGYAGAVEILDDRTELFAMTERMHAMDKMAALGTMGGGIAHEIRNPLNAVKGFARLLERELPDDSENRKVRRWAQCIVEGTDEADAIIESLLAFANPERVKQDAIDPAELAASAVRAALQDEGPWEVDVETSAPPFLGDRIKLRQALRNLVANAAEIQPEGGRIQVAVERRGESIALCVRDAGPGVPPELRQRVTDPFFTTRPEGTGLGLALVATLARLHGGDVAVGAAPPPLNGAEFAITIPFDPTREPES